MAFQPPEAFNIADYFLDERIREGRGDRTAIVTDDRSLSYAEVRALADQFGRVLTDAGVRPEERVILALPDGPEFVGALFGVLKIGAVVVMVNPQLKPDAMADMLAYTRARAAVVDPDSARRVRAAGSRHLQATLVVGEPELERSLAGAAGDLEPFPTHRDDPAIWLFSGGTTGRPKAVLQTHRSFANTTECYARGVLGYREEDVTLSVPKLYFGYATGSNLLFPFAAGATTALFPEPCTAELLFEKIARFRPTILINVPTMIGRMVDHPDAAAQDLSSLRLTTSAGEPLPAALHARWDQAFGVELLDGLGTAEMWHIFLSNRPGEVQPGSLGRAVPGFDVRVRDDEGHDVPDGETGWLWVRGDSRAIAYWQRMERTAEVFRGPWVVTGDMVRKDPDGTFVYGGRADDMLKVSGKWMSPQEVENCLREHPAVREVAVVGAADPTGLVKPRAFVVADGAGQGLGAELCAFVRERLEPFKAPRDVVFLDDLPRTHLGKVDRGKLRVSGEGA